MSEKSCSCGSRRMPRSCSTTSTGTTLPPDPAPVSPQANSEDFEKPLGSSTVTPKSPAKIPVLYLPPSSAQSPLPCTTSPSLDSIASSMSISTECMEPEAVPYARRGACPVHGTRNERVPTLSTVETSSSLPPLCCSSTSRLEKPTWPGSSLPNSASALLPSSEPMLFGDYLFPENPTILDLLHAYQLDQSSKQKDFRQSLQLHTQLMGLSLASRLSRSLDIAYDHAHDSFKNKQRPDRRSEFVSSFNYTHEGTERLLQFALAQPHPRPSFLDLLNQSSSSAILSFLHLLRTNPTILAKAFQNLQSPELDVLLLPERTTTSVHPATQSGIRGTRDRAHILQSSSSGQTTSSHFTQAQTSSQSPLPSSAQYHSPQTQHTVQNFVNNQDVVHIILNNLFGQSTFEHERLLKARTVKCIFVGLLVEKKGERLMNEILERYIDQSEWYQSSRAKSDFEKVLLNIIRRGETSLVGFSDDELNAYGFQYTQHLQHPSPGKISSMSTTKQESDGSGRIPNRPIFAQNIKSDQQGNCEPRLTLSGRQATVEEFFVEACLEILEALEVFSPPCLFELSKMISQDIDEKAKPYASLIIVVKFFFYRFMNKCIGYPETYGMLQDTFIPDRQRQRILFTTHHRLYRYVTSLMSPVPGWESRSPILDPRLKEKIEAFTDHFSLNMDREQTARSVPKSTLQPIADSSIPSPPRLNSSAHAAIAATKGTAVTPFLLLCPSDFTTLFYFVCPNLRRADKSPFDSLVSSSVHMTRSSSFSGEGSATTRQRTSSGTPSTHPQAMKAAAKATNNASNISGSSLKGLPNVSCTRTHKRASPSFSFFAGASVTSRASPPPLVAIEKAPSATGATEASANGVPFIAFSGTKSCLTTSPQMAPVHVTSVVGNLGPTLASTSNPASFLERRSQSASAPLTIEDPPVIKHWSDETLLPSLLSALSEIKNIQQEPIKETSHVPGSHILSPQKEAWALVYVQYCDSGSAPGPEGTHSSVFQGHQEQLEVGLVMAPSCMAMVMENIEHGGSKIVTVTKPMLVDQMMDFAGRRSELGSRSVDLKVDESTTDSTMASEDNSLRYETDILSPQDKEISILRVNSSQESSLDASGTKNIPLRETDEDHPRSTQHKAPLNSNSAYYITSNRPNSPALLLKKTTADRAWKARIRDTVHSEHDFPEDIRSVARSVFKILRGFDMVATAVCEQETLNDGCGEVRSLLLQGMEQARLFGNHSSAIGFHHSLHVLETSNVFRQLDSSKLIYLLAMPLERRLEHRAGRARVRTLWESYAHSWHARVVPSIDRKRESLSSLRIKMYYQTCVRPSRAFEKSLGVVSVLSRLNKAALRKQFAVDEWDGPPGYSDSLSEKSTVFLTMLDSKTEKSGSRHLCGLNVCYGVCFENPCPAARIPGETSFGQTVDAPSRMPSNNKSSHSHANRMGKVRRSSFSSYIDNMTSRSFGAHSLKESGLSNLKEKEQASFSMSNSSNHLGGTFWSQSNESQTRSKGLQSVAEGISNDFVMDAREAEAVQRWVDDSGIHNFLPGEDNFLRFCMEIESVVRGIGLGGTGIQGAGISQAQNGIVTPGLASSGSDFFVKEVAKFNSQFVPGMGPTEQTVTQTRVSGASGVAEFLANSFKSSQAGTSAPTTSGTHFISHIVSQGNSDKHSLGGHVASSQSSTYSSSSGSRSRSRLQQRQAQLRTQLNIQDTIPNLLDDPRSVYASQAGPTYVLYNPPYGTTTHSASSSYSAYPPDNMSSTVAPHHPSHQPKDMPEFLRRIQLQLTSYLMSEWLDIFGEVETDRWLMEFLDELSGGTVSPNGVSNCDHDHDILSANGMRLGDKAIRRHISKTSKGISSPTYSTPNVPTASASSSLEGLGAEFSSESHPIESIASARSFVSSNKSLCSFPSFNSQDSVLGGHGTQLPVISSENMTMAERSNLSIQEADIHEKSRSSAVADLSMTVPYNLQDAYKSTIEKFDHTKSPSRKLGYLFALELLIVASLSYPDSCSVPAHGRPSNSSPRTKRDQQNPSLLGGSNMSPKAITPGTDAIVDEIESVFRMLGGLRPKHLLRDMQLIATFIPGSILDLRDDGKAFWDMALAVTSLKTDVVEYVVKKATRYVEMDDDNSDSKLDTDRSGSRAIMQDDEERVRMSEAVRLFTIGAKESHPVAQRELAILYMSLPMLPSSSSPKIGYHREDISDHKPTGHAPSPVLFTPSRLGPAGTKTTPPASPQGTFSSTMLGSSFMSGGTTASIPIKQKSSRHQHSSSGGTGSSFGSGVLNGLGIMAGLGSFTGSSSTGSASEDPPTKAATSTTTYPSPSIKRNNRSTTSLNQHHAAAFAEGHDIEQYQEMHLVETYDNITSMNQKGASSSHSRHQRPQQQHHKHHHQQRHLHQTQAGDPDKFNPENVAAAMHWFSLAAAQGDQFSINYLKHKETLRGLSP